MRRPNRAAPRRNPGFITSTRISTPVSVVIVEEAVTVKPYPQPFRKGVPAVARVAFETAVRTTAPWMRYPSTVYAWTTTSIVAPGRRVADEERTRTKVAVGLSRFAMDGSTMNAMRAVAFPCDGSRA